MFETILRPPVKDIHAVHQWLEESIKPSSDHPRNYTWGFNASYVYVRQPVPTLAAPWAKIEIPAKDTLLRFRLTAHLRRTRRLRRVTRAADPAFEMAWMDRQCEKSGLILRDVNTSRCEYTINKPSGPFPIQVVAFQGLATVRDPLALQQTVALGIGNAKAYGFGFLQFRTVERS